MKMIPCSPEAEKALLGILLTNNAIYEDIADNLQAKYFSDKANEGLFVAIAKIIESGKVADVITLKNYAEKHLADHGGHQYLLGLVATSYHTNSAIDYSFMIKDLYTRRKLIGAGQELVDHAFDLVDYPKSEECIEMIERQIFELTDKQYSGLISLDVALQQALATAEMAYKNEGQTTGILTGLIDLDRLIGGLHRSDLVIIAGRPSMGKTALATSIVINVLFQSLNTTKSILFFSMEMSAEQIGHRILSQVCAIESDKIRKGQISRNDLIKYIEANKKLSKMPLYIDDTPAISVSYMRILARRAKKKYGVEMIVVDYLQLLRPSAGYKSENRVQEISEMTRQLKAIAKEIDVPMVVLSQLSRASEKESTDGEDHYKLSYLRDSGSIEQDADVVVFVDRKSQTLIARQPALGTAKHEQWRQQMAEEQNMAKLIVAKNRHGPIGVVRLFYKPEYAQFGNFSTLVY